MTIVVTRPGEAILPWAEAQLVSMSGKDIILNSTAERLSDLNLYCCRRPRWTAFRGFSGGAEISVGRLASAQQVHDGICDEARP